MRRIRNAHLWRTLIIVGLFCTWVQIILSANSGSMDLAGDDVMNINETSEQALASVPTELHKYLTVHLKNTTERIEPNNITEIKRATEGYNEAQIIYNEDIYGPVRNDTIIIVIQVHVRLTYLRHLIGSLAQATDIQKTLLIFSHDHHDEEINNVVRSIDFTKVMQIFYPYSIQTHPNEFPGADPNDCPRNANFERAVKLKCNNALHPDAYGHYREAKYTQMKHHWWWKANRIFNQLQATSNHTGLVVFLEEDHYVAEDFIHMLHMLRDTADKKCPMCEILCLGTYLESYEYDCFGKSDKLNLTSWHSTIYNMGFAFNRTVWNEILELKEQFCAYDDYNWDFTFLHLSQNRPRGEFKVIVCDMPRVFHIGECSGMHKKKFNCNPSTTIRKVQKLLQNAKKNMYPSKVNVARNTAVRIKQLYQNYGGWGDKRDQELCLNMTLIGRQMKKYVMIT